MVYFRLNGFQRKSNGNSDLTLSSGLSYVNGRYSNFLDGLCTGLLFGAAPKGNYKEEMKA